MALLSLLLLTLLSAKLASTLQLSLGNKRICEPIQAERCRDVGYNLTSMPNFVSLDNQRDAVEQLNTFAPLIEAQCSSQLKFFLCAAYLPMCTDKVDVPIGPCRPVCERVKERCEPMLQKFGFQWPSALDCEKFPQTNNPGTMCMKGPEDPNDPQSGKRRGSEVGSRKDPPTAVVAGGRGEVRCSDRRRPMLWLNSSSRCAIPCGEDLVWSGSQKHLAAVWLGVSAGLSLVLGVAALCAVATGSPKPRYPERALVFVTLCYSVASIGYLAQLLMGRSTVACVAIANGPSVLVQPGLQNVRCTLMFALVYYFNAAALLWWLILATTWSLATGLKWSPEAIEQKSGWFHFPAWFIPVLQTVAVLVRQSVDADELTGLCGVGFHSPEELFRFHILPALISLVAGMALLTLGFCAGLTCCCGPISFGPIRKATLDANTHVPSSSTMTSVYMGTTIATANRQQYYVAGHLVKLGIFAAFHVVPQGALLAAFFYEYSYQDEWGRKDGPQPNFATFVMKIVASLIFGIVAAVWLLYRRISASWATGRFGQQKAPQSALPYQPHRAVFADKHSLSIAETKLAAHQHYPQLYHHHTII